MIESRLTYLFQAYFNKSATLSERDELMELLAQAENDEQVKTLLAETWQQFNSQSQLFNDSQGEEMLANILKKGTTNKRVPVIAAYKWSFSWLRIAAAAAILFFAVTGVYLWLKPKQPGQQIAQSKKFLKMLRMLLCREEIKRCLHCLTVPVLYWTQPTRALWQSRAMRK